MNKFDRQPLNSDLLRSFLVIAETGNLTHAADRLGRTQSAISVQLRNLEDSLGTALFHRSVRGMTLSHAGEQLLPKARATLTELQNMRELFQAPLSGRLRIGIPDDYEGRVLTDALARFVRAHPGVEVSAMSGCTATYPNAVRKGELDMAVCSGPEPKGTMPITREAVVWAGSHQARLTKDMAVPLAMLDRNCWWKTLPTDALHAAGRDHRVAFRSESFGSLLSALRSNVAIGVLPASCVDDDLKVFGTAEGLPNLPLMHRSILFSETADGEIAQAMAQALRVALPAV